MRELTFDSHLFCFIFIYTPDIDLQDQWSFFSETVVVIYFEDIMINILKMLTMSHASDSVTTL